MNSFDHSFPKDYVDMVFAVWYRAGRPSMNVLQTIIPEDDQGNKPVPETLTKWRKKFGWVEEADRIDLDARNKLGRDLANERAEMMKRQADMAKEVSQKAFDYLDMTGFDTAASAVSALRFSFEAERTTRGVDLALTDFSQLDDTQLNKEFNRLLKGRTGLSLTDDIIEGDTEQEIIEED